MDNHTLADIFEAEVNKPPVMEYLAKIRIEYIGTDKIGAIRALRQHTGLTLKSAKDAITWPGGIVMVEALFENVLHHYTSSTGRSRDDWRKMLPPPDPVEL